MLAGCRSDAFKRKNAHGNLDKVEPVGIVLAARAANLVIARRARAVLGPKKTLLTRT
jgi:hypothetical protein